MHVHIDNNTSSIYHYANIIGFCFKNMSHGGTFQDNGRKLNLYK